MRQPTDQPTSLPDVLESPEAWPAVRISEWLGRLPEDVRKHAEKILAEYKAIEFVPDMICVEAIAWQRWAKRKTNQELADVAMMLRQQLFTDAHNEIPVMLEEIWQRMNTRRPNHIL